MMNIRFDSQADAIYIKLREPVGEVETDFIDVARYVDYDAEHNVVGVEIFGVSKGIDLEGLPEADIIAEALRSLQPASSPA